MSETSLEAKVLSRASKAQKSTKNDSIIDESHFFYDEIIGVGGFGLVRLAVKVEAGADSEPEDLNLYAIKSIPKRNVLAKKNGVLSVYNELRCLTALTDKSPFINKLHHAFHDRRYVYLVLQFCPGGDMRLALRRQPFGVFPENIARFYAAQLILAINAVHDAGIIHRDIKPENLLLDGQGHLQLTDFGVAKFDDNNTCKSTSGTHGYMSPEIYASGHLHGRPADIFAMGVTLHELTIGSRPFEGAAVKEYATARRRHSRQGAHADTAPASAVISNGASASVSASVHMSISRESVYSPDSRLLQRRGRLANGGVDARQHQELKQLARGGSVLHEDGNTDREASISTEGNDVRQALSLRTLEHSSLSRQCRNFIASCVHLRQSERLAYHGYDELYDHAWLRGLDWEGLKEQRLSPPLQVDRTKLNRDTRDFSAENLNNHFNAPDISAKDNRHFREYTYNIRV